MIFTDPSTEPTNSFQLTDLDTVLIEYSVSGSTVTVEIPEGRLTEKVVGRLILDIANLHPGRAIVVEFVEVR